MSLTHLALLTAALATIDVPVRAQTPAAPPFATTQVEGTNNVYIFRYGFHQSMFIVTPQGVIATDPIGYLRPEAVTTYIDEIRKITQAPIRYVIYSHHHYDHIAGGKPFKDAGARFIAHKNARDHLAENAAARHRHSRRDAGEQEDHHARRHHARAHLCRPQPFGQFAGDAAAAGEDSSSRSTSSRSSRSTSATCRTVGRSNGKSR